MLFNSFFVGLGSASSGGTGPVLGAVVGSR